MGELPCECEPYAQLFGCFSESKQDSDFRTGGKADAEKQTI